VSARHWSRPARRVDAAGLAACMAWAWLARASWETTQVPVAGLLAAVALAWAATLLAWSAARRGEVSLRRVVVWALAFRVLGLLGDPVLEDDHYRYLWDGYRFAVGGNPYADAPADHFADPEVPEPFQAVLDRVNYPTVPTIYGPVCQVLFRLGYAIAPAQVWALKAILLALDLVALALLARLAGPAALLLYAWCPLLVQELAFTGHVDAAGVCLLVAALFAFRRRRDAALGALLALAVGVKLLAVVAVPALLARAGRRAAGAFAATLFLVYLPFLLLDGTAGRAGSSAFLGGWEFNSTGFAVVSALLGGAAGRAACALLFALAYLGFLWRSRRAGDREIPRLEYAFAAFFLLSPVVNAWYLLWMLPFVALRPAPWSVAALAVVPLAYVHGLTLPASGLAPYEHPQWVRPVEVGVVLLAACLGGWLAREAEGDRERCADDVLPPGVPSIEGVGVE
jgi:alpha-1,6-mannosyltransferase